VRGIKSIEQCITGRAAELDKRGRPSLVQDTLVDMIRRLEEKLAGESRSPTEIRLRIEYFFDL
jgi:hypothetical protein